MRYFPHILRTVRMGRTRVLPIRPVLRDARNLPAPIVSVIIGLPLPVFATACILLPAVVNNRLYPITLLDVYDSIHIAKGVEEQAKQFYPDKFE